ncbi:HDOD domain-containing protein [Desulfovibrio mangrovi]|uniref:HDOD domain-containing protein n=1 Tax=Desulfovibrio mangrovi TaxID=2976983 RepID=UPI0022470549|nr:HDOD domain-containing protein [Desulfovibrio mangrovi]UZP67351.1 HDOD domain-containing protein [Desulfovibrio mangrovi]
MQHHMEAQDFLADLLQSMQDLPYEPSLLSDLFSLTKDNSPASLEAIGQTIARGQGLAARVLSIANSAYYGLQSEVSSVSRAVAVLGLKEVRNLVLAIGVAEIASKRKMPKKFEIAEYWMHQVGVGEAARLIALHAAKKGEKEDPDTLYTAGLLHDLGKLFIASFRPLTWAAIRKLRDTAQISDAEAEDRYWGMDHAVIAAHVLSYWNLPDVLTDPISWHHQPRLAGEHKCAAAMLHVANALLHSREAQAIPMSETATALLSRFVPDMEQFESELALRLAPDNIRAFVSHLI